MEIQPYLFFQGRCEEAAEFYRRAVGAEVTMSMRWKDNPEAGKPGTIPPGSENKIMHMEMRIGGSTILASDGESSGAASFQGFALSLLVKSEAEADRAFAALSDGGEVRMPLTKTFFSSKFGMLADRFGVMWMVYVGQEKR
jgi:PhnB protein